MYPQFQNTVRALTPGLPNPYQVQSLVRSSNSGFVKPSFDQVLG